MSAEDGFIVTCKKCQFTGDIKEFKLFIETDAEIEEDYYMEYQMASLKCPKCENEVDLVN